MLHVKTGDLVIVKNPGKLPGMCTEPGLVIDVESRRPHYDHVASHHGEKISKITTVTVLWPEGNRPSADSNGPLCRHDATDLKVI
ncbi:MAG: hypothetical protein CME70_18850 [Halobacteriovorax sp.]|nr:hypothetical protein [Halobacteriovorax sp.]